MTSRSARPTTIRDPGRERCPSAAVTVPDPAAAARVRSTVLIVLGAIVCVALVALVVLAETGQASPLGAVVGTIGSAAVGALAGQLSR